MASASAATTVPDIAKAVPVYTPSDATHDFPYRSPRSAAGKQLLKNIFAGTEGFSRNITLCATTAAAMPACRVSPEPSNLKEVFGHFMDINSKDTLTYFCSIWNCLVTHVINGTWSSYRRYSKKENKLVLDYKTKVGEYAWQMEEVTSNDDVDSRDDLFAEIEGLRRELRTIQRKKTLLTESYAMMRSASAVQDWKCCDSSDSPTLRQAFDGIGGLCPRDFPVDDDVRLDDRKLFLSDNSTWGGFSGHIRDHYNGTHVTTNNLWVNPKLGKKRTRIVALVTTLNNCFKLMDDLHKKIILVTLCNDMTDVIKPPPPKINGEYTSLIHVEEGDVDPVTLEPFESGDFVYVMNCCRNKLLEESVKGILASGRTPKCPMCRHSLLG